MSAYIKLSTLEYPRHEGDIRLECPEITEDQTGDTFPCPSDYALVEWVDPPHIDYVHQRFKEGPPELVDGVWKMTWVIFDTPASEVDIDPRRYMNQTSGTAPNVIS